MSLKIKNVYLTSFKNICPCAIELQGSKIDIIPKFFFKKCLWKSINSEDCDLVKVFVILYDDTFGKEFFTKIFLSMIIRSHLTGKKFSLIDPQKLYDFMDILINEFLILKKNKCSYDEHQLFSHYREYYEKISPIYKISYNDFITNINPIYDYNLKSNINICCHVKNNVVFIPKTDRIKSYIAELLHIDQLII